VDVSLFPARKYLSKNSAHKKNVSRPGKESGTEKNLPQTPNTRKPGRTLSRDGKIKILIIGKTIVPVTRHTPGKIESSNGSETENEDERHLYQ
jgi:hypothetical protein